jgi:hypothetical protein
MRPSIFSGHSRDQGVDAIRLSPTMPELPRGS